MFVIPVIPGIGDTKFETIKISCSLQSRYYKIDEKVFCEDCKEKNQPHCGVCDEVLSGQYVTVGGEIKYEKSNDML